MAQSFFDLETRREYLDDFGRRHERFPYALNEFANEAELFFSHLTDAKRVVQEGKTPRFRRMTNYFNRLLSELDESVLDLVDTNNPQFDVHSFMGLLYNHSDNPDVLREIFSLHAPISRSEPIMGNLGEKQPFEMNNISRAKKSFDKSVRRINEKPKHLREFSGRFMDVFKSLYVGNGFRHLGNYINFLHKGQDMECECYAFVLPPDKEAAFLALVDKVEYLGKLEVPKISRDAENWFFTNGWSPEHDAYNLSFSDGKEPMVAYLANEEGELLIANEKGKSVINGRTPQADYKDSRLMASDLNQSETGLGDRVLNLLDGHNSIYRLRQAEEEITGLLSRIGLSPDGVYVDRGNRRVNSLTTILEDHADKYSLAIHLDL